MGRGETLTFSSAIRQAARKFAIRLHRALFIDPNPDSTGFTVFSSVTAFPRPKQEALAARPVVSIQIQNYAKIYNQRQPLA